MPPELYHGGGKGTACSHRQLPLPQHLCWALMAGLSLSFGRLSGAHGLHQDDMVTHAPIMSGKCEVPRGPEASKVLLHPEDMSLPLTPSPQRVPWCSMGLRWHAVLPSPSPPAGPAVSLVIWWGRNDLHLLFLLP